MKRREFVEKLGIGSAGIAAAAALAGTRVNAAPAKQHEHGGPEVDGPLAQATVSFGQWSADFSPALDRLATVFPATTNRLANNHHLIPYVATIKAGGAVNFLFSGTHNLQIFAPGTTVDSINTDLRTATDTPFGGFINDPTNRIYRGLDPRPLPQDRLEAVTFAEKGTYLVICGVVAHFVVVAPATPMHGFVKVV
jgi:hypothetical protein